MRNINLLIIANFILFACGCNYQQGKNETYNDSIDVKSIFNIINIKKSDNPEQEESKQCLLVVKEILITSPRYKKITNGLYEAVIKNGGLYFGINLAGTPNPAKEETWKFSKTYDFEVYEMYKDRQLNIARFSFNPIIKQLYEYDAALDKLNPIEFDRTLLLKYDEFCKCNSIKVSSVFMF